MGLAKTAELESIYHNVQSQLNWKNTSKILVQLSYTEQG